MKKKLKYSISLLSSMFLFAGAAGVGILYGQTSNKKVMTASSLTSVNNESGGIATEPGTQNVGGFKNDGNMDGAARYKYVDDGNASSTIEFGTGNFQNNTDIDGGNYYNLLALTSYNFSVPKDTAYEVTFNFDISGTLRDLANTTTNLHDDSYANLTGFFIGGDVDKKNMKFTIPGKDNLPDASTSLLDQTNIPASQHIINVPLTKKDDKFDVNNQQASITVPVSNMGIGANNSAMPEYLPNDTFAVKIVWIISYNKPRYTWTNEQTPRVNYKIKRDISFKEFTDINDKTAYVLRRVGNYERIYLMDRTTQDTENPVFFDKRHYKEREIQKNALNEKSLVYINGEVDFTDFETYTDGSQADYFKADEIRFGYDSTFKSKNLYLPSTYNTKIYSPYHGQVNFVIDKMTFDQNTYSTDQATYWMSNMSTINIDSYTPDGTVTFDFQVGGNSNARQLIQFESTSSGSNLSKINLNTDLYINYLSTGNGNKAVYFKQFEFNSAHTINLNTTSTNVDTSNYNNYDVWFQHCKFKYSGEGYAVSLGANTFVNFRHEGGNNSEGSTNKMYDIPKGNFIQASDSYIIYGSGIEGALDFTNIEGTVFDLNNSNVYFGDTKRSFKFKEGKTASDRPHINVETIKDGYVFDFNAPDSYSFGTKAYIKFGDNIMNSLGTDATDVGQSPNVFAYRNYSTNYDSAVNSIRKQLTLLNSKYSFAVRQDNTTNTLYNAYLYVYEHHIHTMKKVEALNATCEKEGNKEYWKCDDVGVHDNINLTGYKDGVFYASDDNGIKDNTTLGIDPATLIIAALGHQYDQGTIEWKNGTPKYYVGDTFNVSDLVVRAQCTRDDTLHGGSEKWVNVPEGEISVNPTTIPENGQVEVSINATWLAPGADIKQTMTVDVVSDEINYTNNGVVYSAQSPNRLSDTEYQNATQYDETLKKDPNFTNDGLTIYSKIRLMNIESKKWTNGFNVTIPTNSPVAINKNFTIFRVDANGLVEVVYTGNNNGTQDTVIDFTKDFTNKRFTSGEYYIASHTHQMTEIAATDSTCETAGNYQYWECVVNGKHSHDNTVYFKTSDPFGETYANLDATKKALLSHEWSKLGISTLPTKVNYNLGEAIDLSGISGKLWCYKNGKADGHKQDIDETQFKTDVTHVTTDPSYKKQNITVYWTGNKNVSQIIELSINQRESYSLTVDNVQYTVVSETNFDGLGNPLKETGNVEFAGLDTNKKKYSAVTIKDDGFDNKTGFKLYVKYVDGVEPLGVKYLTSADAQTYTEMTPKSTTPDNTLGYEFDITDVNQISKYFLVADHKHNYVHVAKKDATCQVTGTEEHYECDDPLHKVKLYFTSNDGGVTFVEVSEADLVLSKLDHDFNSFDKDKVTFADTFRRTYRVDEPFSYSGMTVTLHCSLANHDVPVSNDEIAKYFTADGYNADKGLQKDNSQFTLSFNKNRTQKIVISLTINEYKDITWKDDNAKISFSISSEIGFDTEESTGMTRNDVTNGASEELIKSKLSENQIIYSKFNVKIGEFFVYPSDMAFKAIFTNGAPKGILIYYVDNNSVTKIDESRLDVTGNTLTVSNFNYKGDIFVIANKNTSGDGTDVNPGDPSNPGGNNGNTTTNNGLSKQFWIWLGSILAVILLIIIIVIASIVKKREKEKIK